MAFQNVGKPRFYVDLFQYWKAIGEIMNTWHQAEVNSLGGWHTTSADRSDIHEHPFGIDPYKQRTRNIWYTDSTKFRSTLEFDNLPAFNSSGVYQNNQKRLIPNYNIEKYINFGAILDHGLAGHIFAGQGGDYDQILMTPLLFRGHHDTLGVSISDAGVFSKSGFKNIYGMEAVDYDDADRLTMRAIDLNGFSIWEMNDGLAYDVASAFPYMLSMQFQTPKNTDEEHLTFRPSDHSLGSIVFGRYYDMPQSPNMKLTFSRDFDGIDVKRTRGGSDLVNVRYTGAPNWGRGQTGFTPFGGLNPIESRPKASRPGRRSWQLSFDQLSDDDLMGAYESVSSFPYSHSSWQDPASQDPSDDGSPARGFFNPLLEEDNFFSQVIVKTLNGKLPFIFQPDNTNNSPDQFAICRIKDKSFKISQKSHKRYSIKMTIEESW